MGSWEIIWENVEGEENLKKEDIENKIFYVNRYRDVYCCKIEYR